VIQVQKSRILRKFLFYQPFQFHAHTSSYAHNPYIVGKTVARCKCLKSPGPGTRKGARTLGLVYKRDK